MPGFTALAGVDPDALYYVRLPDEVFRMDAARMHVQLARLPIDASAEPMLSVTIDQEQVWVRTNQAFYGIDKKLGNVLRVFPSPAPANIVRLASIGDRLYETDPSADAIRQIDKSTGAVTPLVPSAYGAWECVA